MTPSEHYQAGQLDEAIEAAFALVKKNPTDYDLRGFLCELLCFTGDLERADKQLEVISNQAMESAVTVALFRQLVRAETARQQFFNEGRVPEILAAPSETFKKHMEASILCREGDEAGAAELLASARETAPLVKGTLDGTPFQGLRDLDDVTSSVFEVLTSTGKYYWIPMERVETLEFRKPERPRDLLWRPAHMVVQGGPDGEVFLPTLYPKSHQSDENPIRLGRATDWLGDEKTVIRGNGLRTFLVGDEDKTMMELGDMEFEIEGES